MLSSERVTLPSPEELQEELEQPVESEVEDSGNLPGRLRRYRLLVAAAGILALSSAGEARQNEHSPFTQAAQARLAIGDSPVNEAAPREIAIMEDSVRSPSLEISMEEMRKIAETGVDSVKVTALWVTGQTAPSQRDLEMLQNTVKAAKHYNLKVILAAYTCPHVEPACKNNDPPLTQWERGKHFSWLASLAHNLPEVQDFVVGNEPNSSTFHWPQFKKNGADAAAESYYKILAGAYDVLKKAGREREGGKEITVYGMATSSSGSQPPLRFIRNVAKAYKKSGRKGPIMDALSHHPYPRHSSERPSVVHRGNHVGIADYPRLVKTLDESFAGTAQLGAGLPVYYAEFGYQSKIPAHKAHYYFGDEQPTVRPASEADQARYLQEALQIMSCQPNVIGFTFFLNRDERNKKRWQSGLRYADDTPKSTLRLIKPHIKNARNGTSTCR